MKPLLPADDSLLASSLERAVVLSERAETCRLLTSRVLTIKQRLVERYRIASLPMPLIRDAIAAAEADAWLSGFPHLFLPDLADEVVRHLLAKAVAHPEYAQAA
jgi:hypothetical protein